MTHAIIEFCLKVYGFLLPFSWIAIGVVVVILLPMAAFRKTRATAGLLIFYSSYLFGVTTWFLGAAVTFMTWGWIGLLIGLLFFGIGVVPIAILAAFISLHSLSMGVTLIAMVAVVLAARIGGATLIANGENVEPAY